MANFKVFGQCELHEASEILRLYAEELFTPVAQKYFGVLTDINMDTIDGVVYASDEDYNMVAINPAHNALDLLIVLPDSRVEGFLEDLVAESSQLSEEDADYLNGFTKYLAHV